MSNILDKLSTRYLTGNAAIDYLTKQLSLLSPDDSKVLERMIEKDPKCGVSEATVNKIWKGLVPTYPVMLCSAYDQKLVDRLHWKNGVYVQLKSDGMRCNIRIDAEGKVTVFSRNGRLIDTHGVFDYIGNSVKSVVIDGELLVKDKSGKFLDRKTGNGICNKALKGTITKAQCEMFFLNAWDIIDLESFESGVCNDDYETRYIKLFGLTGNLNQYTPNHNIGLIETKIVHSLDEAQKIFEEYLAIGEEGAILKDKSAIWEDKRSRQLIKLKAELDADLIITDVIPGTGKYEGMIGSFMCTDKDNKVKVNVGTGLSDEQRKTLTKSEVVGKIITVTYNAKIQAKTGEWSLFLPRFIEIREDKNIPNSFGEIK